MNTIIKKPFCVLFSINKPTLKLYVNIITITNSVYFVCSVVNKETITKISVYGSCEVY
jgi:hypothetical protein